MSTASPAVRGRGVATGLLTAALAVAAHGVGSGVLPTGSAAALLAVISATVGALAATITPAGNPVVLVGLLGAGQLVGHLMLDAAGHHHAVPTAPPAAAMLAAHVLAIGRAPTAPPHRPWRKVADGSVTVGGWFRHFPPRGSVRCSSRRATDCGVHCREPCVRWFGRCRPSGRRPPLRFAAPISRCVRHCFSPLRCRIGARRPALPADRRSTTQKANPLRSTTRATSRALITVVATGATMCTALLAGAATASAHVRVESDGAAPGKTAVVTFRVPGESETGALTTQLTVSLPDVASARTEVMPGWTARIDRDTAAGTVRAVTWTAAPGTGISPDQFALFRVSVKLPEGESVSFPATQTYSDATVVRWDQPPLPDGSEPEYPAPVLTMAGVKPESADDHPAALAQSSATDNSARWLAGGALSVAAVAVAAALLARRRT